MRALRKAAERVLDHLIQDWQRFPVVKRLAGVIGILVFLTVVEWSTFAIALRPRGKPGSLLFISYPPSRTFLLVIVAWSGVGVLATSAYLLFTIVLTPEFWPPFDTEHELQIRQHYGARLAPHTRAVNCALVFLCVAGLVGAFAAVYLELAYATPRCFTPNIHHHIDAIYVAVTNFTTVGSSGFSPHSGACRLLVAGESVLGLVVVAVGVAVLAARLVVQRVLRPVGREDDENSSPRRSNE